MKGISRLDRLIYKELAGPYFFGVALFTVLIVAATYLGRLLGFLVGGTSTLLVGELALLYTPAIMVKTFAMAMLLASLLAFGRLSGDSEIVALKAAGAGLQRIMRPVMVFAVATAVVAFITNETLVPYAAKRGADITAELAKQIDPSKFHAASQPIIVDGKSIGDVVARDFNPAQGILKDATVILYRKDGSPAYFLSAQQFTYDPLKFAAHKGGWSIQGQAHLISGDGSMSLTINNGAWPAQVPQLQFTPQDILASQITDLDVLSMREIKTEIENLKKNPNASKSLIANLEFGYWNKIALPFAAIIYGLLGAPLGIRSHRQSTASGFALAIAISFAYLFIANWLSVYAQGGAIPAWAASFTPPAIGLVAAIIITIRRNR